MDLWTYIKIPKLEFNLLIYYTFHTIPISNAFPIILTHLAVTGRVMQYEQGSLNIYVMHSHHSTIRKGSIRHRLIDKRFDKVGEKAGKRETHEALEFKLGFGKRGVAKDSVCDNCRWLYIEWYIPESYFLLGPNDMWDHNPQHHRLQKRLQGCQIWSADKGWYPSKANYRQQ